MNESNNRPAGMHDSSDALATELAMAAAALTAYFTYRQAIDERRRKWKVAAIVFFFGLITSALVTNWLTHPQASPSPHPVATRCANTA